MKKKFVLALTLVLVASLSVCFVACNNAVSQAVIETVPAGVTIGTEVNLAENYSYLTDLTGKTLNVGAIMVGDETEGYTEAHMAGIEAAVDNIEAHGGTVNVTWEKKVGEDATCAAKASALAQTNDIVITNSYGHQFQLGDVVTANPDVTFISMTGDLAASTDSDNYKNAFTDVYQSRYVSGVVAGLKLQQLVADGLVADSNKDNDGNIKIGYVGAFAYAEVVSGYTAFFLGIKSVVSNVVMHVQYTNSWFDFNAENQTAKALIAEGCIIIGQHADSEGAPSACEEAYLSGTRVYSVGYNVDMLEAAPHAALTSSTNNWAAYYTYAFYTAMSAANGAKAIATDWAEGYSNGAVAVTAINGKVFSTDPSATVKGVVDDIVDGTLKVFDCSTFKVDGANLTTYTGSWGMNGQETILGNANDGYYFSESTLRSAPYFDIRIDGITETGAAE